ncbi:MAG: FecR domain-containing protein [Patescibacteria group bacterium]
MKKTFFIIILLGIFTFATLASGFFSVDALAPDVLTGLQEVTHLELAQGTVWVNGQAAEDGTPLHEGDTIELQSDASASLVFFDGSVSRLRSGTKITITKLSGTDPESPDSQIELELSIGKVWSKVIKLINNESMFSVATNEVAATVRGSAFDVEVSESGNTTVMATEHSLSLQKVAHSGAQTSESVLIVEGQKATSYPRIRRPDSELVAKTGSGEAQAPTSAAVETPQASEPRPAPPALSSVRFKIEEISEEEKQTVWFQTNQKSDDQHEIAVHKKIEKAQEQAAGALPGTGAYRMKNIRDTVLLATTRKPEKLAEVQAKIAERKILEAQVMLRQGAATQADEQIAKARELLSEFNETRQAVTDPQARTELDQKIANSINNSKKLTKLTTALDRDYQIKEFIDEAEVTLAPTAEKEEIKKEQYQRRIIEAYDLTKEKRTEAADKVVKKLAQDIKNDFTAPQEEKAISEASLKNLVTNPYLNAVIHRVPVVEAQQLAAKEEAAEKEETVEEKEKVAKKEETVEKEKEKADKEEALAGDSQPPERVHAAAPKTETFREKTADLSKEEKRTETKDWLEKKVKEANHAAAEAKKIQKQNAKEREDDTGDEDYFFPADNVILADPALAGSGFTQNRATHAPVMTSPAPDANPPAQPNPNLNSPDSAGTTNPTTNSGTGTVQGTPAQVDMSVTTPIVNSTAPATSNPPAQPNPNLNSPDSAGTTNPTTNSGTGTVQSTPTQVSEPTTDSADSKLSPDSSQETVQQRPTQTSTGTSTQSHDLWKSTENSFKQMFNFSTPSITIPQTDFGTNLQKYLDTINHPDSPDRSSQLPTESNMLFSKLLQWLQPTLYPTR